MKPDTAGFPKGWGIYAPADDSVVLKEYHVAPIDDTKEHLLDGDTCWCHPKLEIINDLQSIYTHHSADGRELIEQKTERLM